MNNFVQPGNTIPIAAAPSGGLLGGQGFQVGQLFGVVAKDADTGDPYELHTVGVFDLPKADDASEAWSTGALIYWDSSAGEATTVASLNLLIGVAVADAEHDADKGKVRLNGVARAQETT